MFKPGDYIIKMIDPETRYVRRIVAIEGDKYVVEDPMFVCWGSTFHSWKRKVLTQKVIDRSFKLLDPKIAKLYAAIKKDDSTRVLFRTKKGA